jgi:thiol-disulfide isomerase/thioredoxin
MKINDKIKDVLMWSMLTVSVLLLAYHTVRPNKVNNSEAPARVEIKTGTTISQLEFKRPNGEDFAIPQKGKYLVAFLTTGCEPCRQQMPRLNELAQTNSYDGVIGIFF